MCAGPGIKFSFSITPQVTGRFAVVQVLEDERNGSTHTGVDHPKQAALPFYPRDVDVSQRRRLLHNRDEGTATSDSGQGAARASDDILE